MDVPVQSRHKKHQAGSRIYSQITRHSLLASGTYKYTKESWLNLYKGAGFLTIATTAALLPACLGVRADGRHLRVNT
ncbi:hypothetical protein CK934_16270 [Chitinophaga sp. MD30]|nr:hypothetical protein CK934_16270 [Chitinophaga sp. MD30]